MKGNPEKHKLSILLVLVLVLIATTKISGIGTVKSSGKIFLYGEKHSVKKILDKELQLWGKYYKEDGVRDLFVEFPYYTAEFLNLWMKAKNDDLFNEVFEEWKGTPGHSQDVKDFYQNIKLNYPETIFHGTDVGHGYATTGERYLKYLRDNGKERSPQYSLAKEVMEQGRYYYEHNDEVYRENKMTENFVKAFDKLKGVDVVGIYGSAHTDTEAMDYSTKTIPNMANQLKKYYGALLKSEDLSMLALEIEPLKIEKILMGGK